MFFSNIVVRVLRGIINRVNNNMPFKKCGVNLIIRSLSFYCWNPNVVVGNNVQIYPGVVFFGDGDIVIEDNVKIGNNVVINASKKNGGIKIGKGTIVAANSYIIDSNHGIKLGTPICEQEVESSPLYIGKYCWIGANCTLGRGTNLGNGCVVGANSFVNKTFVANSIVAGTPAKFIKERV